MLPDDYLGLLVHLDDQQGQGLIALIPASATQDPPELLSVNSVVCFLEVDEGRVVPPFLALPRVDLGKEPRNVSCC